ncbi:MAG: hypothetical protein MJY78_10290 [Fibrobacter sp.]|nr:hypothetical protein [Fibrobacter sp.]
MKEEERKSISQLVKSEKWLEFATMCYGRTDECLDYAKEKGWLKTSNGDYSSGKSVKILSCIIGLSGITNLECLKKNIVRGVNKRNKKFIHSLLILLQLSEKIKVKDQLLINSCDICNYSNIVSANKRFVENAPHKEVFTEQVSYIFNSQQKSLQPYDINASIQEDFFSAVKEILLFRDIEELVHNFSVNLEKIDDKIVLKDDEKWLASLSYGFLRLPLQRQAKVKKYDDPSKHFITDCLNDLIGLYGLNNCIEKRENVLTLNMPLLLGNKHFIRDLKRFINSQEYYRDELIIIHELYGDLQITVKKLGEKFINESISIMDLLRFHRLSCFFDCLIGKNNESQLCMKIKCDVMKKFLDENFGSVYVAILDLLTMKGGYTDLQYTPFLKDNLDYIIPFSILCNSNIVQNTMRVLANKARFDDHSNEDLIADKYKEAFDEQGIPYYTGLTYDTSDGHHGELDLVYQINDEIYISENKNMLPPTCYHDAINCVKYYEKAYTQKSIFMHYFNTKDPLLMSCLESLKDKGIAFDEAKKVNFYLTFGNRFVLCKNTVQFPVVYISEIVTMIKNSPKTIYRFGYTETQYWRDHKELYPNDMNQYLYSDRSLDDCKLDFRMQSLCNYKITSYQYQGYCLTTSSLGL